MLFFILGLLFRVRNSERKFPIHRKWELADGRFLLLREGQDCYYSIMYTCDWISRAYISDGTNEVSFTKTSGTVKLADGRTAGVGNDNYLRIVGSSLASTETHHLGVFNLFC